MGCIYVAKIKFMKHPLMLMMCLSLGFSLYAQKMEVTNKKIPIRIALMDESISFPNFWFTRYDYNPAVMLGTEHIFRHKNKQDWLLAGNVGFYHHKHWQTAVFLNVEIGYRYHLKRFNGSARLGLGYAHVFHPGPVYSSVDGTFEEVTDYGSPAFMPSLSLNIGYRIKEAPDSPELFLTFMSAADLPFNIFTALHQFVGVGCQFYLPKMK